MTCNCLGLLNHYWSFQLHDLITPQPWGTMWCTTYRWKWNDEDYPHMSTLPTFTLSFIYLILKQIWLHCSSCPYSSNNFGRCDHTSGDSCRLRQMHPSHMLISMKTTSIEINDKHLTKTSNLQYIIFTLKPWLIPWNPIMGYHGILINS